MHAYTLGHATCLHSLALHLPKLQAELGKMDRFQQRMHRTNADTYAAMLKDIERRRTEVKQALGSEQHQAYLCA